MAKVLSNYIKAWQTAFQSRSFRNQLVLSLLVLAIACLHNFYYLRLWQLREGTRVNDFLLNLLPPHDFSPIIFFVEYGTLLLLFIGITFHPDKLVKGFQMAALVMFARTMCIYFFPLEPPREMIYLNDPFATFFLHTHNTIVTKDLFYSGHVSILALAVLLTGNKYLRAYGIAATSFIGALLMWQHVHYTLDIICAPMAAFIAYRVVLNAHKTRFGMEFIGQEQM